MRGDYHMAMMRTTTLIEEFNIKYAERNEAKDKAAVLKSLMRTYVHQTEWNTQNADQLAKLKGLVETGWGDTILADEKYDYEGKSVKERLLAYISRLGYLPNLNLGILYARQQELKGIIEKIQFIDQSTSQKLALCTKAKK